MDTERRFAGKLFHTTRPDCKARVPSTVLRLGTMRHLLSADWRCHLPITAVNMWQAHSTLFGTLIYREGQKHWTVTVT